MAEGAGRSAGERAGEPVVISSLVVETLPGRTDAVAAALEAQACSGVEVHERVGAKLVVSIEAPSLDESQGLAAGFAAIEGVTGVNLVYVHCEDDPTIAKARAARA